MKAALLGILTVILVSGVVWSQAQTSAERPPGIAPDNWIPLSENVGIVVLSTDGSAQPIFRNFAPSADPQPARATGRLMARHKGQWLVFDELVSTEARLHPAL